MIKPKAKAKQKPLKQFANSSVFCTSRLALNSWAPLRS